MATKTDTESLTRGSPFEAYEFATVRFLAPNQDVRVPHTLIPESPDRVGYMVVANDGDGVVSDSRLNAGAAWSRDALVLRCSRAPCTVGLLLVVLRDR